MERVAVSGTSGSCLLVDAVTGKVTRGPSCTTMLYAPSPLIDAAAPPGHCTRAPRPLAKLLHWARERKQRTKSSATRPTTSPSALAGDKPVLVSDWHNALKLGFDIDALRVAGLDPRALSMRKRTKHADAAPRDAARRRLRARRLRRGFGGVGASPAGVEVVGGTTDSIAAFVACATDIDKGALNVAAGDAVTSLGSTTALKLVGKTRVDDSSVGVYSHRLEDNWLVGGASNAGCRVLREFAFTNDELEELDGSSTPQLLTGTRIYPLVAPGTLPVQRRKQRTRPAPT